MSTWCELLLREQTVICGKWNHQTYRILKLLGQGANGIVYLVERAGLRCAMKIGLDTLALQSEMNGLRALRLDAECPFFIESDDFELAGHTYTFYIMRYIEGESLRTYLQTFGTDWLPVLGLRILRRLQLIHQKGYIFGDLKSENMLVSDFGRLELIDYGGLTKKGQAIRQFTEKYDRGHWRLGSRVAEESYDIFAFAILCLESLAPNSFEHWYKKNATCRNFSTLLHFIENEPQTLPYRQFFSLALKGKLKTSSAALEVWRRIARTKYTVSVPKMRGRWLKIMFASSILLFVCTIFYVLP